MTLSQFVLITVIMALGAIVQGTVGFGMGLLAVPLLMLLDPVFVPGPILGASGLLTILLARREWHAVQRSDLGWAVGGRVIGTLLAMAAFATLSDERLHVLFGALVLGAVALTASGLRVHPVPRTLGITGIVSGFMGTLTSVGGPPIALLYQHESGPRIRGTLSAFFVVGAALSLSGLAVVGRFGAIEIKLTAFMFPGILLGFLVSRFTAGALDRGFIRPAVLVISAIAALAVIVL